MVRVNAGCKGCIKPPSSLEEEEKKIFKMSQRQKPLETVGRSSNTGPTKSTIRQQKLFLHRLYSEGTNCRE